MIEAIQVIEEVPYGLRDISNTHIDYSIPISVEVVPQACLIEESNYHSNAYLNFQIFRLTENRINRDILINQNRESAQNLIKRIKCILYVMVSIPITIILLGYISTIWNDSNMERQ
jgi:hypothetical protein